MARKIRTSWVRGLTASIEVWYGVGIMALQKTSIQVDPQILKDLETRYYGMSRSEIIRLCIEYVHETKPEVEVSKTRFVNRETE